MISEIEITNFRSIRHDCITLEPLTVLIGANGSGKPNLVKALEFLSDLPSSGISLAIIQRTGTQQRHSRFCHERKSHIADNSAGKIT